MPENTERDHPLTSFFALYSSQSEAKVAILELLLKMSVEIGKTQPEDPLKRSILLQGLGNLAESISAWNPDKALTSSTNKPD